MSADKIFENKPGHNPSILSVSVTFGDIKAEFSGDPNTVLHSMNSFLAKEIPDISLAKKLSLNFSAKELVDLFQKYVKITPEGPRVWSNPERKYSDKEIVALQLVAQRIAAETIGANAPSMTLGALQDTTALNPKSLSSRLSELAKTGFVVRENSDEGTTFRITTQGIDWLAATLAKKV
ncbi:MAG: hypothetical protein ACYC7D_11260 [Nitrososphaerales archaeon]